jgi:hypothetical protein
MTVLGMNVIWYPAGFFWALTFAFVCASIARGKGHSGVLWGILGFFFSCVTLVVVLLLPRRGA